MGRSVRAHASPSPQPGPRRTEADSPRQPPGVGSTDLSGGSAWLVSGDAGRRTGPALGDVTQALGDITQAPSLEVTATAVTDQISVERVLPDRVVTEL